MTALPALLLVLALSVTSPPTEANAAPSRTVAPAAVKPAPVRAPAGATAERPVRGSAQQPAKVPAKVPARTAIGKPAVTQPRTLSKALPPSRDVSRMTPRERRCYGRINQPAASVLLNRTQAPRAICVQSCEAKLIAPRRESGRIAALTLYTGRACRLPPGYKERPATEIASTRPSASGPRRR